MGVSKDKKGYTRDGKGWKIRFTDRDGKRKSLHVGKMSESAVARISRHVKDINTARKHDFPLDDGILKWLGKIDDSLHSDLVKVGLVDPRESPENRKLGIFLNRYLDGRIDIKSGTRFNLELAIRRLIEYFKYDRLLDSITPYDADAFRIHLKQTLADNTVRRTCSRARQFFNAAIRKRLLTENPFGHMRDLNVKSVDDRFHYVTREEAQKVLETCPDSQWRYWVSSLLQ